MTRIFYAVDLDDVVSVLQSFGLDADEIAKAEIALKERATPATSVKLRPSKAISRSLRSSGGSDGVYVCTVGLEYGFKKGAEGEELDHNDPYNRVAWCGRSFSCRGRTIGERESVFRNRMAMHRANFFDRRTKSGKLLYPNGCLDNVLPLDKRDALKGCISAPICSRTTELDEVEV